MQDALVYTIPGDGQFGEKSVADIAAEYMEAGRHNLHRFKPPNISFVFFDGITESIAREHNHCPFERQSFCCVYWTHYRVLCCQIPSVHVLYDNIMCVCSVLVPVRLCVYHLSGVLAGRGIQVVGPVYADDSTEDPPSLAHVTSLFRESIRGGLGVRDSGSVELLAKPQSTISTEW